MVGALSVQLVVMLRLFHPPSERRLPVRGCVDDQWDAWAQSGVLGPYG